MLLPVPVMHVAFIMASIILGYWWVPLMWYGSLVTTFMMFFRFRLWIEHQGTFDTQRITLNPLQAAIIAPHKIWLHWEHHRYPAVPYYNLERTRKILHGPTPITLSELIDNLSHFSFLPSGATIDDPESKRLLPT